MSSHPHNLLHSAFGDSDGNGGHTGWTSVDVSDGNDWTTDLAIQADGKIVIGGGAYTDFTVLRYTEDGVLDGTFDGEGGQGNGNHRRDRRRLPGRPGHGR